MHPIILGLLWAMAIGAAVTTASAQPVLWNACSQDSDCYLMNGVCAQATGNGKLGRCVCPHGQDLDDRFYWCDTPRYAPVLVESPVAVLYGFGTSEDTLNRWRLPPEFPRNWTCSSGTSGYCWARDETVEYATWAGALILGVNRSLEAWPHTDGLVRNWTLPIDSVAWSCRSGYEFYKGRDDAATVGGYSYGIRPFGEHCHANRTCSNHGCRWDECRDGYFGDRCQYAIRGRLWRDRVGPIVNHTTNETIGRRRCVEDGCQENEVCYASGYCWCRPGTFFSVVNGSKCIEGDTWRMTGVPLLAAPDRSLDIDVVAQDPLQVYGYDGRAIHAFYTPTPPDPADPTFRLSAVHFWDFYCNNSVYYGVSAVTRNSTSGVIEPQDAASACSDPCPALLTGLECERCVQGYAGPGCAYTTDACSATYCTNRNGTCTQDKAAQCACGPRYYGERCETFVTNCSQSVCNGGRGTCLYTGEACVCQPSWFGSKCEWNAAMCRSQRCGDKGACRTQTQSCECELGWDARANCSEIHCYNDGTPLSPLGPCVCEEQYTGTYCEERVCTNGFFDGVRCLCVPPYFGPRCANHTCGKGTPLGTDRCSCPVPYVATPNMTCTLPCTVNGTFDGVNRCVCGLGYGGLWCEKFIGYKIRVVETDPVPMWVVALGIAAVALFVFLVLVIDYLCAKSRNPACLYLAECRCCPRYADYMRI